MDALWVRGGRRLQGTVEVAGAKNAVLPMMATSLLASGPTVLRRVPSLRDVQTMAAILDQLGVGVRLEDRSMHIDPRRLTSFEAPYELVRTMRASIYVLGPLVARWGKARVSLPGGCAWGPRPVNFHLQGLRQMGATLELEKGYIVATCRRLRGAKIYLDFPSVGATIQLMMAASLAQGETAIENAAREPEVTAIADMLTQMGSLVEGAGSPVVKVQGVIELAPVETTVIPDRIEAGTYLAAGAITRGDVEVSPVLPQHLMAVTEKLEAAGCTIQVADDAVRLQVEGDLKPIRLVTAPFPGFPTDMQAQMMALACTIPGTSVIQEGIYHDRFSHVPELGRLGADIELDGPVAIVKGGKKLQGATVMATDLRASVALVLVALVPEGRSKIRRIYHLDRGYEALEAKLGALGADVERFVEK